MNSKNIGRIRALGGHSDHLSKVGGFPKHELTGGELGAIEPHDDIQNLTTVRHRDIRGSGPNTLQRPAINGRRNLGSDGKIVEKQRLNTREAAQYTGIPVGTLRRFRSEGRGPIYSKPAGRAIYDKRDLDAFLASGLRLPSVRASKERERNVAI